MDFFKSLPGKLKLAQLVLVVSAAGIMTTIFNEYKYTNLGEINLGEIWAAVCVTLVSILMQLLKLERKSRSWKIFENLLQASAGLTLAVAWGLFVFHVADADDFVGDDKYNQRPGHKTWLKKACSALVLEGLAIPLYFTIPWLSTEKKVLNKQIEQ